MKVSYYLVALFSYLLISPAHAACSNLYQQQAEKEYTNLAAFDQTQGKGWRLLAENSCYLDAAKLIKEYSEKHKLEASSLKWHYLQMLGFGGETQKAIEVGHTLIQATPNSESHFMWKEYIIATVAFLERDNKTLMQYRNRIAKHTNSRPNAINLGVLDRLINNIKKDYATAYFSK